MLMNNAQSLITTKERVFGTEGKKQAGTLLWPYYRFIVVPQAEQFSKS